MKYKILSLAFLLFISVATFAQSFNLGIKAGANLGKMSGQAFKDQFTLGYHVGAFAKIGLGEKFAIQPEVLFSQVNVDTANNFSQIFTLNSVDKINLQYLTIPILLNYNLAKVITVQVGPQFGILMDNSNNKKFLQNGEDAFKSGNFSMVAGLQLNLLKIKVYGRFVGGLTDIRNIGNADTWKTETIQLGLGLSLF